MSETWNLCRPGVPFEELAVEQPSFGPKSDLGGFCPFNIEADPLSDAAARPRNGNHGHRWLVRGLLTNLLNPKVGVFYVTLLPQFIPRGGSIMTYSFLFTSIHVAEGLSWLTLLTIAVGPLRSWLRRPAVTRGLDCGTGTVLIGAGLGLALERRR